jgi:hypothetical protein
MADGFKSKFKQAAHATGQAAIWTVAGLAGVWVLAKAGEMEAEEEAKRPPIIAKFDGLNDTFSEPFTTNGPWQISWQGDLDIDVWTQNPGETPVQHGYASGSDQGTAFFPEAGTFFLVIRLLEARYWSITIRSR